MAGVPRAWLESLHRSDFLPTIFPILSTSAPILQYNVGLFDSLSVACLAQLHRFNTQVCI